MKLNKPKRPLQAKKPAKLNSYSLASGVKRIQRHSYPDNWEEIKQEVKARDNYCCAHKHCCSTLNIEVHHIIPLSRGGTNKKSNLITLCEKHHHSRHKHL